MDRNLTNGREEKTMEGQSESKQIALQSELRRIDLIPAIESQKQLPE
jgi:hypothetical protein